jgi:hypothetical protein
MMLSYRCGWAPISAMKTAVVFGKTALAKLPHVDYMGRHFS